ncbi:MAG: T9SS type A sorting domain-containing protein, partial [Bacteroidota bacterium]
TSGIRMVSAPGNVGHNLAWTVNGLDPNIEYFWSVQAVDASHVGSAFAAELSTNPVSTDREADLPGLNAFAAYPNPFAGTTQLQLDLAEPGDLRVEVYDALGRLVSTMADEFQPAGTFTLDWVAPAAGSYFVRAETVSGVTTQRITAL